MLQEISRITIPLSKNEEASICWHNSILLVRTEKYIHFYDFSYNLKCLDKKLDFVAQSIPVSKSSPLKGLIPGHFLKESVSNIDYTEMVLDPALWPHNQKLVDEMTNFSDLQWSPAGFLPANQSGLAITNNIGNVEVYGRGRHKWINILDLSEVIKQNYLSSGQFKTPRTLMELKNVAYNLATSSICWGPNLVNGSCLFVTAQKNGYIFVWILLYKDGEIVPELLGKIQTEMDEVVSMKWISKPGKEFVIIGSNIYGQIFALDCCISDDNFEIKINNRSVLWPQKDKMVTTYMCYDMIDDNIVLICNKHRHLMVIIIDKNCQVVTHFVRNINDYRITDIISKDNEIYLTTINCKIYKIIFKALETDLDFDLQLVEICDSYVNHELSGIAFSINNVICALALKNRKILHRQRALKTCDVVFFYTNPQLDELTILMQNPTQILTNHWDCVELLRYKTIKTKILPSIDYDFLYKKAETGIYELKLYLVFLNFFLSLEKLVRNRERKTVPEMSVDNVKENILALQATKIINEVHENRKNGEEMLEITQQAKYIGAKKYLGYYCSKNKRDIGEFVNTTEIMAGLKYMNSNEEETICQCCDEAINGFTCKSGHFNMFCSLTFTPIDDDYVVCRSCGATARSDLYSSNPMCIFCDLYLSDVNVPT